MQADAEPLPQAEPIELSGLFLVTADEQGVANCLIEQLRHRGAQPILLSREDCLSLKAMTSRVEQGRQQHGPVRGIVHLAGLQQQVEATNLTEWRYYTWLHSKVLFHLLKLCGADLQEAAHGRVVSASLMGGYFGRHNQSGVPSSGGSGGLLKTMVNEWPNVHGKSLDFSASLSSEETAAFIEQELRLPGGRIEVGYPQGQRTVFRTVSAPHSFASSSQNLNWQPSSDWVVMATGGARGITSEILLELSSFGCTLILLGRSPLPETEDPETEGVSSVAALRKIFLTRFRSQGLMPTPVQIEQQIKQLLNAREIHNRLRQFRQRGAKVEYLSVDVSNGQAFSNTINRIYDRYGRLDFVVHGAGLILDKLIQDKTPEAFNRVFDTKVDSAFILSRQLRPAGLKGIVFFSSVAGRYGNRGQCDYAAANEVMNRIAWQLRWRWPHTRTVAINWGPWDSTGMASDEVKQQFRTRGIEPIPLPGGCKFFYDELRYGDANAVEVIAGAGPWEEDEQEKGQLVTPQKGVNKQQDIEHQNVASSTPQRFPLITAAPALMPDSTVILDHRLTLEHDLYLTDHRLDNKPVLPAAAALEWMAEFVQAAWPEWVVSEVRDLRVMKGIVLQDEAGCSVRLRAKASSHADASALQVTVDMVDPERNLPFYRGHVILRPALLSPPFVNCTSLGEASSLEVTEAYQKYLFHGKRFQLVNAFEGISPQGIDAWVEPSHPSNWMGPSVQARLDANSHWLFDPGLLDVPPQLAIVWSRMHHDTTALPTKFGTVVRYDSAPSSMPLRCLFRINSADATSCNYDAWYVDANGAVYLQMQNIQSTCNPSLNRLAQ